MNPRFGEDSLDRFRTLLRIPTVGRLDETLVDWPAFDAFLEALTALYPLTHRTLEVERVGGYSLLMRWSGGTADNPTVLMGHYDVVSVNVGEHEAAWEHPPFAAEITGEGEERVLWGRGTIDDKGAVVAILEAVEASIAAGFVPARDLYLSFGHNEETTGAGARATVELLESRGIVPGLVVDEGGAVVEDVLPGLRGPAALVGTTEKGLATITLSVAQIGGHASTPPPFPATARLARAITRVNASPFPGRLSSPAKDLLRTLGPHSSAPLPWVAKNVDALAPILAKILPRLGAETAALVRTTTVATQLTGASAANALPERATAVLNVRIAVGSSVAATVRRLTRVIADPEVEITVSEHHEPSPVSPASGPGWERILAAFSASVPDATVSPYVMLGASDSRYYARISSTVYRTTPFRMSADERAGLHAINERIRVSTWLDGIEFYRNLVLSS
ncbi:M20/M25/M40 family metallo-hydrolase [Mycetocola tolaasinivorans]|uniref:M20/M25/M40 family metallo-hydrolase n=1 Tax=Mycetocola tolaasinivorans TaxID=76635 RepID=A0A3L7A346_9MICO|nr:M20/M25/M40 family metallo-hydrolase [Mycetocola tolaasinivorans]RLP74746.1 M20/M25/M40 family metallo-hydrolase [Mycetocola tolaasinivorans]